MPISLLLVEPRAEKLKQDLTSRTKVEGQYPKLQDPVPLLNDTAKVGNLETALQYFVQQLKDLRAQLIQSKIGQITVVETITSISNDLMMEKGDSLFKHYMPDLSKVLERIYEGIIDRVVTSTRGMELHYKHLGMEGIVYGHIIEDFFDNGNPGISLPEPSDFSAMINLHWLKPEATHLLVTSSYYQGFDRLDLEVQKKKISDNATVLRHLWHRIAQALIMEWKANASKTKQDGLKAYRKADECPNYIGDNFPILAPDNLGNLLINDEIMADGNSVRFKRASSRDGDHLMIPFQCETCWFCNLKGSHKKGPTCPPTKLNSLSSETCKSKLGLNPRAYPTEVSSMLYTPLLLFKCVTAGCHHRMGDVWLPDNPITVEIMNATFKILDQR
eukprot:jgi/Psemu1/19646/gm1.19646_g